MPITLEHMYHTYQPDSPFQADALTDIDFTIEDGDLLALIGHTGSGKSTLAQHLNGLLTPTAGRVLVDGQDINEKGVNRRALRQRVGLLFQYAEYQLFEETVYKDIAFGPQNQGKEGDELDKAVREAADFTGLKPELLQKSPFDLSGGEKRRAAIAGVIAMDPEVLVLDEPTAGLDPMGREVLLSQIVRYHKERDNTILLVSHTMEDVARFADKIIVMNKGRLEMFAPTKEVFSRGEELESFGLKIPQITKIMRQLRQKGFDVPEGVLTVDEALSALLPLLKKEGKLW